MYALQVARALRRAGAQVCLITTTDSPPVDDLPAHPLLPPILPLKRRMLARLAACAPAVRRALAGCDVVHNTIEMYAPLAAAVAGSRPFIMTAHGTYANLPRMRRFPAGALYAWAFRRAHVVCVSHYTAGVLSQALPGIRHTVIPNGVSAEDFANLPKYPKTEGLIVATGGIKARKGTLELVQALAVVRQQQPAAHLIVTGSLGQQAYLEQVQAAISALGLEDAVTFAGILSREALAETLARAQVFALPSINHDYHFEGFGLAHLEASAAGLPVIGTRGCGVEDAVEDGVTGLLLAQDKLAEELPRAILRLLNTPDVAQTMGNAGKLKAQQMTWDKVAQRLLAVYRSAQ
jgi:glycosyltransferase involved in cell wall biosynthesis